MTTSYYFWGHQRVGLLRGREKMVYWCMPLFLSYFSLFVLPLSFFLSFFLSVLLLLVFYYSLVVSCSPFGLFFSWVPLSRFLLLFYHESFPLGAFAPLGLPLSAMVTFSFYSELIQWDFSPLPLELHQLFLACFGHPFKTTHQPIGCPTTSIAPLLISWQNSLLFVPAVDLYLTT